MIRMADPRRIGCAALEARPHADPREMGDDAGPRGQRGEHASKKGRLLLKHVVASNVRSRHLALCDGEQTVWESCCRRKRGLIVLPPMGDDQVMVLGCECTERVAHKFEAGLHALNEAINRSSLGCTTEQRCMACLHEAAISDGAGEQDADG